MQSAGTPRSSAIVLIRRSQDQNIGFKTTDPSGLSIGAQIPREPVLLNLLANAVKFTVRGAVAFAEAT
jgi:hypothetical protein